MPSRFFFFNDTATTEIYTLSLHDALPILSGAGRLRQNPELPQPEADPTGAPAGRLWPPRLQEAGGQESVDRGCCAGDRKSTRLNSSHANISYAVFCLKKNTKITHACPPTC